MERRIEIRRPLLYVAVCFAAAILIAFYAGYLPALGVLLFLIPVCRAKPFFNPRRTLILLMTASYLVGFADYTVVTCIKDPLADTVVNSGEKEISCVLYGTVKDTEMRTSGADEEPEQSLQLDVRAQSLILKGESMPVKGKSIILARCYEGSYNSAIEDEMGELARMAIPGAVVELHGELAIPNGRRNPGCFDYSLYLKSIGIETTFSVNRIYIMEPSHSLMGTLFSLRESFLADLQTNTNPETAAMMRAIMFGDKGLLDEETREVFQKNGTAHILAVSGLHIGLLYSFLLFLWSKVLGLQRGRMFFLTMTVFFVGYAALSGFSPSVVRAVFMVLLHVFAKMTGRRYDMNSAAFLVTIIILLLNPFMIFNMGFQMSFLAVLTMALILPYIKRLYTGLFLSSAVIQLGLAPFIAYNYNYFSIIAMIINVPVIFLAGFIMPAGLIAMFFSFGPLTLLPVAPLAGDITMILCKTLTAINEFAAMDGVTVFQVASPPAGLLAVYYLGLLMFASEEGRLMILRHREKIILWAAAGVLLAGLSFNVLTDDGFGRTDAVFVDVGQGDCIHLKLEDRGLLGTGLGGRNRNYLIDGGGSPYFNVGRQTLKPYLLKNGVTHVDGAFVTHLHTDHYKGICELAKEGMVDRLYTYDANRCREAEILEETGLEPEDIVFLCAGETVDLGKTRGIRMPGLGSNAAVSVLWPAKKTEAQYRELLKNEEDENALSLIMRVELDGRTILVTGDMDEVGEKDLLQEYRDVNADILKIAHHGSKYSSSDAFLDAVKPGFVVIQVGKNNYGHPTPEVLLKLDERGVPVYRNDLDGAVGIEIEKGAVKKIRKIIDIK